MSKSKWHEIGEGVFHRRYDPVDVSVGLIVGPSGATVIDTRNNPKEAREVLRDVQKSFDVPVVAAINTHAHYDHTFGNQVFRQAGIPVYGHHLIPQHFEDYEEPHLLRVQQSPQNEPDKAWKDVVLTAPDQLIHADCTVTLGGRKIELKPLAPGHTDTDLAVFIPDAGVWFLGDVIEESGPPMFGSGSYPLTWHQVLEYLLTLMEPAQKLIPGHGNPVAPDFIARLHSLFELLAQEIREAHERHTPVDQIHFSSLLRDFWPVEFLREAATDGYGQLSD